MHTGSAAVYDVIYADKDYAREALRLNTIVRRLRPQRGGRLLDVGCGTGCHAAFFRYFGYAVEGLDLDPAMLDVARGRYPDIPFHQGDMQTFRLDRTFDVITCLFSAIGYLPDVPALRTTIANLARHLRPGGVLIIEPWFTRDTLDPGVFAPVFARGAGLTVALMVDHEIEDDRSRLVFHHLVQTPAGTRYIREDHVLSLFPRAAFLAALRDAGLTAAFDPAGLPGMGRGLYVAQAPAVTAPGA